MKKVVSIALLSLTTLAAAQTPIRFGCSYWLPNLPADIAEKKGWFEEAGLKVEIRRFDTTQSMLAELKAGQIDIATDMIGTWAQMVGEHAPITILGETDWSHGGDKLILNPNARPGANQIAVYINNVATRAFLQEYLTRNRLSVSDYPVVELENEEALVPAFTSGKLRGVLFYDPYAGKVLEAGGQLAATTADFPGVMPEGFAIRNDALARVPRKDLVTFFRLWFRGVAYASDPNHAEEIARIASEITFAGSETFDAGSIATHLAATPMHDQAKALEENSEDGNLRRFMHKACLVMIRSGILNVEQVPKIKAAVDTSILVEAARN
jgi:NitT/TauT family transport system substrate-binding protein